MCIQMAKCSSECDKARSLLHLQFCPGLGGALSDEHLGPVVAVSHIADADLGE